MFRGGHRLVDLTRAPRTEARAERLISMPFQEVENTLCRSDDHLFDNVVDSAARSQRTVSCCQPLSRDASNCRLSQVATRRSNDLSG
jgi:hypothetical protein